jgi:oxygen-independent coproporphyrinogen-3 oxidase
VSLAPEHISAYGLSIEEGTPLATQFASGEFDLPDEETAVAIFSSTIALLQDAGYDHYEISNFARPGRRSRHNQGYWQRKPYLGLGAAAHSFLREPGFGVRWYNPELPADYASAVEAETAPQPVPLTKADAMAECIFLGLRTKEGVSLAQFQAEFGIPLVVAFPTAVPMLLDEGMLVLAGDSIALSARGEMLANQVLVHFV